MKWKFLKMKILFLKENTKIIFPMVMVLITLKNTKDSIKMALNTALEHSLLTIKKFMKENLKITYSTVKVNFIIMIKFLTKVNLKIIITTDLVSNITKEKKFMKVILKITSKMATEFIILMTAFSISANSQMTAITAMEHPSPITAQKHP